MNLCSDGHEEVCYEGRKCPVCALGEEKDKEIAERDEIISEREGTIASLNDEVASLLL